MPLQSKSMAKRVINTRIDEKLDADARKLAARLRRSYTSILEEGIELVLAKHKEKKK